MKTIDCKATVLDQPMAEAIATYAFRLYDFKPCYWCGSDPSRCMLPNGFMHGAQALYWTNCGRYSGNKIDGQIIPFMTTAWLNDRSPWHEAITRLLVTVDDKVPSFRSIDLASSFIWVSSYGQIKGVRLSFSQFNGARPDESVYDWTFFMALRLAINQAASARLNFTPVFDLSSREACLDCGANPNRHVMRNFSEVLREGDIHCGGCGKFIRTWDPN